MGVIVHFKEHFFFGSPHRFIADIQIKLSFNFADKTSYRNVHVLDNRKFDPFCDPILAGRQQLNV